MELAEIPVEELLPHDPPMVLLDRVTSYDESTLTAEVDIRPGSMLCGDDGVPGWVGIEYMAQAAAVHAALSARSGDAPSTSRPVSGGISLLGTRRLALSRAWLEPGEALEVEAEPVAASSAGLAVFATRVRDADGNEVARARLNLHAEGAPLG